MPRLRPTCRWDLWIQHTHKCWKLLLLHLIYIAIELPEIGLLDYGYILKSARGSGTILYISASVRYIYPSASIERFRLALTLPAAQHSMKKDTCTRPGRGLGWSSTVLVILCSLSLLGNAKAFQSPTPQSLRQGQGVLAAASYSAFEDNNNSHPNGNGNGPNNGNSRRSQSQTEFSFSEKRSIESRLDRLEQTAAATLQGFYEPHLLSFSIKPGSVNVRSVSKTVQ
jgi:hypothetical protein